MIKLKPESVPLYLGHQSVSAYFPFGETAVTNLIEGQLAFLHHVRNYEEQLDEIAASVEEVTALKGQPNGWAVKNSKSLSHALRHNQQLKLGKFLEASIEQLDEFTSLRPFRWEPRKFFASLMANSKGRFQTGIAPMACSFSRFLDWDFSIGISAIQGHSRMPEQVADIAQGERLTAQRLRSLDLFSTPPKTTTTTASSAMVSFCAPLAKGGNVTGRLSTLFMQVDPSLRGLARWCGTGATFSMPTARHRHVLQPRSQPLPLPDRQRCRAVLPRCGPDVPHVSLKAAS
ncbi:unnamed protein product [Symbiodinium necroappetens]|uniref:Uncharacterized protein n=1 Tax=Symbiodinium necroappetens TaxID=1628268 RepID=A0A813C0I0_9DINO|nr:unnamed protein product [Symbiodinium necroappetens]